MTSGKWASASTGIAPADCVSSLWWGLSLEAKVGPVFGNAFGSACVTTAARTATRAFLSPPPRQASSSPSAVSYFRKTPAISGFQWP